MACFLANSPSIHQACSTTGTLRCSRMATTRRGGEGLVVLLVPMVPTQVKPNRRHMMKVAKAQHLRSTPSRSIRTPNIRTPSRQRISSTHSTQEGGTPMLGAS
eukprot:6492623-Amphidinium_carterae.3